MIIFGAGLAGLLAAMQFQTATILEAGPEGHVNHKALLRFRSGIIGESIGIPFRKVTVRKGIWADGEFCTPTIEWANRYAMKVIGQLIDRSIWNIEAVERYIAPEDVIPQLIERCGKRILWNMPVTKELLACQLAMKQPIISTIPMSVLAALLDITDAPQFTSAAITVRRFRIPHADVFQTIYYPSPDTTLYRVSITGDLVIAEYVDRSDDYPWWESFGLSHSNFVPLENVRQSFGKIAPIDDAWRRHFMFQLTQRYNIFSLGRFSTWRNILLDDVFHDLNVIKKLMVSSAYSVRLNLLSD